MTRLYGAQRLVLQMIRDLPQNDADFVTDTQIAESTKIAHNEVRDWIDTLENEGYVEVVRTEAGLSASITAKGRLVLPPSLGPSKTGDGPDKRDPAADRLRPELLPVSSETPAVLGIAVDVSASMLTSIGPITGEQKNRLQSVLESVKGMAGRHQSFPPINVFAYGFGFQDRAANFGSVVGPWGSILRSFVNVKVPSRIGRGRVRDLFDLAGFVPSTLTLEQVNLHWARLESGLHEQMMDLGGNTPMGPAVEDVDKRFAKEFGKFDGIPHSALLIVSDGESTEGDPRPGCDRIKGRGTVVLGCYLNATDVVEPKTLYDKAGADWPRGARTLFDCSSALGEEVGTVANLLSQKGWKVKEHDKLFIQANQSSHVEEFLNLMTHVDLLSQS